MAQGVTGTVRAGRFLAQGRGRARGGEAPLRLRLRGRRLVHGDQRQRHHLARLARLEPVPRQGHLHGDAARHAAHPRHAGERRLRARALDARRRPDGRLAGRPLPHRRAAGAADARAATASRASATATTTTTCRRSAPTTAWPDLVARTVLRRDARGRAHRLAAGRACSAPDWCSAPQRSTTACFDFAEQAQDRSWMKHGVQRRRCAAGRGARALGAVRLRRLAPAALRCRHRRARGERPRAPRHRRREARRRAGTAGHGPRAQASSIPAARTDRFHSFPSRHTAVMWAAVTPYAQGVRHAVALRRRGAHQRGAHRQPRALALRHRRRRPPRLRSRARAWEARRESRLDKGAAKISVGLNQVNAQWQFD